MIYYINPTILKVFTPKSLTAGVRYISYEQKTFDYHRHPYEIIYGKFLVPTMRIAPSRSKSLKSPVLCYFSYKLPQNVACHDNMQT